MAEPPGVDELPEPGSTRRQLAVSRSLDAARARAEKRVQRFLDAGFELLDEGAVGNEFTVQEVVARSGQSLRSFYQYFAGKYELLLALFEESVRATADHLRTVVGGDGPAAGRLHRFVVEYYRLCRPDAPVRPARRSPTPAMGEFAQQLLTSHPGEAAKVFVPLVAALTDLLDEAAAEGAVRPELANVRVAGIVLQAIMFNAFATTISGAPPAPPAGAAAELWQLVVAGLGSGPLRG
ncbi:MAG: TetR/AcrR family transcriptional regulator [Acidimicrobiales bacterium]